MTRCVCSCPHLAKGYSGHSFDRQAGSLPFGITILKPTDEIASRAERCDRLEREDAVGTTAIGDDLAVPRKLAQAIFQLAKRDVEGAGKMSECKLVFRPHIKNRVMNDYFHARDALEAVSRKDLVS